MGLLYAVARVGVGLAHGVGVVGVPRQPALLAAVRQQLHVAGLVAEADGLLSLVELPDALLLVAVDGLRGVVQVEV